MPCHLENKSIDSDGKFSIENIKNCQFRSEHITVSESIERGTRGCDCHREDPVNPTADNRGGGPPPPAAQYVFFSRTILPPRPLRPRPHKFPSWAKLLQPVVEICAESRARAGRGYRAVSARVLPLSTLTIGHGYDWCSLSTPLPPAQTLIVNQHPGRKRSQFNCLPPPLLSPLH